MRKLWLLAAACAALAGPAVAGARPADPVKQRAVFEKALARGSITARADLGRLLIGDNDEQARKRGFDLLTQAYAEPRTRSQAAIGLGVAYLYGAGVAKDVKRGVDLLEEGVGAADAQAQYLLGRTYQNGWGGRAKDPVRSLGHFRECARLGEARCDWDVGMAYLAGEAVNKDEAEAYRWVRKSAKAGDVRGQVSLAVMLAVGEGVALDGVESRTWYQKAAEQGSSHALRELGGMYLRGEGGAADEATGFAYIELAADTGDETAGAMLKQLDMPEGPAARMTLNAIKSGWIKAHGNPWADN